MKLDLYRQQSKDGATLGSLFVDGKFECFTLEDENREQDGVDVSVWKVATKTCIPEALYRVVMRMSSRFKRMMIAVINVAGFVGILFHEGNSEVDTDGCILVGQQRQVSPPRVLQSKLALAALQPKIEAALKSGEKVWLQTHNFDADRLDPLPIRT